MVHRDQRYVVLRKRITTLWKSSHSLDHVKDALTEENYTHFIKCDQCQVTGRLEPFTAPTVQQNTFVHGSKETYSDLVPCIGFLETKRSLLVLCIGCLFTNHQGSSLISIL